MGGVLGVSFEYLGAMGLLLCCSGLNLFGCFYTCVGDRLVILVCYLVSTFMCLVVVVWVV